MTIHTPKKEQEKAVESALDTVISTLKSFHSSLHLTGASMAKAFKTMLTDGAGFDTETVKTITEAIEKLDNGQIVDNIDKYNEHRALFNKGRITGIIDKFFTTSDAWKKIKDIGSDFAETLFADAVMDILNDFLPVPKEQILKMYYEVKGSKSYLDKCSYWSKTELVPCTVAYAAMDSKRIDDLTKCSDQLTKEPYDPFVFIVGNIVSKIVGVTKSDLEILIKHEISESVCFLRNQAAYGDCDDIDDFISVVKNALEDGKVNIHILRKIACFTDPKILRFVNWTVKQQTTCYDNDESLFPMYLIDAEGETHEIFTRMRLFEFYAGKLYKPVRSIERVLAAMYYDGKYPGEEHRNEDGFIELNLLEETEKQQ